MVIDLCKNIEFNICLVAGFKLNEILEILSIIWEFGNFFWICLIVLIVVFLFFLFFLIFVEIGKVRVLKNNLWVGMLYFIVVL